MKFCHSRQVYAPDVDELDGRARQDHAERLGIGEIDEIADGHVAGRRSETNYMALAGFFLAVCTNELKPAVAY